MKIGIIYWTGTGNTAAMAEALAEGARTAGADCDVINISDGAVDVTAYDRVMLGCPAMGDEELEDMDFLPFYEEAETTLGDRPVLLFGSYSWNNGEWMDSWKARAEAAGLNLKGAQTAYDMPDDDALEALRQLGADFAG